MAFPTSSTRGCVIPAFVACPGVCIELFDELTDMRADLSPQHNKIAFLVNLVKPASGHDGNGGIYFFDSTSDDADDGVSVIRTNATPITSLGRYLKW